MSRRWVELWWRCWTLKVRDESLYVGGLTALGPRLTDKRGRVMRFSRSRAKRLARQIPTLHAVREAR